MPNLNSGGRSVRRAALGRSAAGALALLLGLAAGAEAASDTPPRPLAKPDLAVPLPVAKPALAVPLPVARPQPVAGAARAAAEFIAASAASRVRAAEEATVRKVVAVGEGDTLMNVLVDSGAGRDEAHEAVSALSELFNPRRLKAGQEITLVFRQAESGEGPELVSVSLSPSFERDVLARRGEDGSFAPAERSREFERGLARLDGTIESSLYIAATGAKLPLPVLMELIRILSFDVDFQRDIQRGDHFDVIYERDFDPESGEERHGEVVYAALSLGSKELKYYRYTPEDDGRTDYFDEQGRSVRKTLMRTPIDGARLTSRFGKRKHPILGYTRVHPGVDFGAPKGTPIYAAGDGVVEAAGWEGNYGRYVRIRHNRELKTAYAHMSALAKSVARGARVRQGQVIGHVGSTGLSTGPHLHYEVMRLGKKVNPLSVKLPTGRHLGGAELDRFRLALAALKADIAKLESAAEVAAATR